MGLRQPMWKTNLLADKLNANPLNILVHLQLLWLHNAYQFQVLLPFGRNLKRQFWDTPFWGLGGVLAVWDSHQSKAQPRLPNTFQYIVLLYLPPFGCNSNIKLWPLTQLGGQCGPRRHLVPTFLFDFCTHYRPILHRLAIMRNAGDRQSDRNRPPML